MDSQDPGHVYLSTYCWHGLHAPEPGFEPLGQLAFSVGGRTCRLTCKHCGARCVCNCHTSRDQP